MPETLLRSGPPRGSVSLERVPGQENVLGLRTESYPPGGRRKASAAVIPGSASALPAILSRNPPLCQPRRRVAFWLRGSGSGTRSAHRGGRPGRAPCGSLSSLRNPVPQRQPSGCSRRTAQCARAPPLQSWRTGAGRGEAPPATPGWPARRPRAPPLVFSLPLASHRDLPSSPGSAEAVGRPWRARVPESPSGEHPASLARACMAGCLEPEVHRRKNPDQSPTPKPWRPGPHSLRAERIKTQTPQKTPTLKVLGNNGNKLGTNLSGLWFKKHAEGGPRTTCLKLVVIWKTPILTVIVFLSGSLSGLSFLPTIRSAPQLDCVISPG